MTAQQLRRDVAILVPAAGAGVRMGPGVPKALRLLAGEPLLVHAIRAAAAAPCVGVIVVAAPPSDVATVAAMLAAIDAPWVEPAKVEPAKVDGQKVDASGLDAGSGGHAISVVGVPTLVVPGGATRQGSVAAALSAVPVGFDLILVHDAARALTPAALIESVAAALRAGAHAVIPVLPVVDTIKRVGATAEVVATVDRSVLRVVQTPQGFRRSVLAAAHAGAVDDHTDDAGLVERGGVRVDTVPGDDRAFKITRPFDLAVAEALLTSDSSGAP